MTLPLLVLPSAMMPEEGYEHIVDGGRCTGKQFAVLFVYGRDEKIECGRYYREACGHYKIAQTAFEQIEVMYSYAQPYPDNRPHKR